MKLLTKSEVSQSKELEKKREIDEGAKLAKKIDLLREISSKEESNLAKFRNESIARTKLEIDELIKEKNSVKLDIDNLKEQRKPLLESLDSKFKEVEKKSDELDSQSERLHLKIDEYINLGEALKNKIKECELDNQRISDLKVRIEDELKKVHNTRIETEEYRSESENTIRVALENSKIIELKNLKSEKDIEYKLHDISLKYEHIKEKEEEIEIIRKQLADQRETLQRAMNRINK